MVDGQDRRDDMRGRGKANHDILPYRATASICAKMRAASE